MCVCMRCCYSMTGIIFRQWLYFVCAVGHHINRLGVREGTAYSGHLFVWRNASVTAIGSSYSYSGLQRKPPHYYYYYSWQNCVNVCLDFSFAVRPLWLFIVWAGINDVRETEILRNYDDDNNYGCMVLMVIAILMNGYNHFFSLALSLSLFSVLILDLVFVFFFVICLFGSILVFAAPYA